jgi:uncharacterized protein YggE
MRMSRVFGLIGSAALVAALLTGCGSAGVLPTLAAGELIPAGGGGGGVAAVSTTDQVANGLWVVGTGEASADPEVSRITFGVDLQGDDPAKLVEEGTRKIDQAISAIEELGVAEADIKTMGYNLWVETVHDPETGRPTGEVMYRVSHQIRATVHDLDTVGSILSAVVQAGANTVSEVSFGVEDPQALIEQARRDALKDAKERAQRMAAGLGITLGKPMLVTEGSAIPYSMQGGYGGGGGGAMAESAAVSISPGAFSVSVNVQVVYEIQ